MIFPLRVSPGPIRQRRPKRGPFVYRLGHLVFNQARGVRLPYGLPLLKASYCFSSSFPAFLSDEEGKLDTFPSFANPLSAISPGLPCSYAVGLPGVLVGKVGRYLSIHCSGIGQSGRASLA
jgi:hypothetical protein